MTVSVYVGAAVIALGALASFAIPSRKRAERAEELAPALGNAA